MDLTGYIEGSICINKCIYSHNNNTNINAKRLWIWWIWRRVGRGINGDWSEEKKGRNIIKSQNVENNTQYIFKNILYLVWWLLKKFNSAITKTSHKTPKYENVGPVGGLDLGCTSNVIPIPHSAVSVQDV